MLRFFALVLVGLAAAYAIFSAPADTARLRLADGRLPNILLLSVDTLRADHLGYVETGPSGLTPELDILVAGGTAFTAASTPAPTTRAATAALLTGAYRGVHGVRGNGWPLGVRPPVLAQLLGDAGYRTSAFYGNRILGADYGFGRGFETYESFAVVGRRISKDEIGVARARAWLESGPDEPWFLWVHLMDPHGPYDSAPESVLRSIPADDARPNRVLPKSDTNTGLGVLPKYQRIPGVRRASSYRRRYRAEVRHSDAQAGKLLAALDELGLADDTLVVLTADHGEGLGDHEYYFQHGWFPYEGSVAVPLAFRLPGRIRAGVRLPAAVSLVDVAPTLLGGLGLPIPSTMQGRDLSPGLSAARPSPLAAVPVFSASTLPSGMTAVRLGSWKLVHTPLPPEIPGGSPWDPYFEQEESFRLFDLSGDPGETVDVSADHPERVRDMRALLQSWEAQHLWHRSGPPAQAQVDPELREMLRALGYAD